MLVENRYGRSVPIKEFDLVNRQLGRDERANTRVDGERGTRKEGGEYRVAPLQLVAAIGVRCAALYDFYGSPNFYLASKLRCQRAGAVRSGRYSMWRTEPTARLATGALAECFR